MSNLSGATTAVFVISLSAALEMPVTVAWETKDGTAKAGSDYEATKGEVTFEPGETAKNIQVTVFGRDEGDTETRTFSILLYPPENAILDQTLNEVEIRVTDVTGTAVASIVVATGPRGLKGDPGLSSYQLAVLQGFTGTMEEWIQQETAAGNAANRAEQAANTVDDKIAVATSSVVQETSQLRDEAEVAKAGAESARDAATATGRLYVDTTEGLANTTNGQVFATTDTATNSIIFWRNVSGTAVKEATMAGADAVNVLSEMISAEVGLRTDLLRKATSNPSYIVVFSDKSGREVLGLRASDGAPTDHTIKKWLKRINEDHSVPVLKQVPGYGLVFTMRDSSGSDRMTELAISSKNGQFAPWVVAALADRLAPLLGGKIDFPVQRPTLAGTWKHDSGDYVPYNIDKKTLVGLGSSSTNRSNSAYSTMAAEFGANYVNMGDEGATILQNAAQIGAIPALLTVSGGAIPANGPVSVTSTNMPINSNLDAFSGTLAGVHGQLSWSTGSTGTFTRTTGGSVVSVPAGTPFIPDAIQYRDKVIILESGKNDINGSRAADLILADTLTIAKWFAPFVPMTVVMGHFANASYTTTQRQILAVLNQGIKDNFGGRAIDQQAWLTSASLWTQLAAEGVTPTTDDLADQAAGDVPRQLMTSARDHLTPAAYGYRMKYLVKPKLIELGLYTG